MITENKIQKALSEIGLDELQLERAKEYIMGLDTVNILSPEHGDVYIAHFKHSQVTWVILNDGGDRWSIRSTDLHCYADSHRLLRSELLEFFDQPDNVEKVGNFIYQEFNLKKIFNFKEPRKKKNV